MVIDNYQLFFYPEYLGQCRILRISPEYILYSILSIVISGPENIVLCTC